MDDERLSFHEALRVLELQGGVPRAQQRAINVDIWRSGMSIQATGKADVLSRVLQTFCIRRPDLGYVQGMNYIAAEFLVIGLRDADAFNGLVFFVEKLGKGYFEDGLTGLLEDVDRVEELLGRIDIETSMKIERLKLVDGNFPLLKSILSECLLTFFARSLTPAVLLRVWDILFLHGKDGLLATAVAVIGRQTDCFEVMVDSPLQNAKCFVSGWAKIDREEADDLVAQIARIIPLVQLFFCVEIDAISGGTLAPVFAGAGLVRGGSERKMRNV
jgi:hypothetical protein